MFGGITDYPLSKIGQTQANSLAKTLEKYWRNRALCWNGRTRRHGACGYRMFRTITKMAKENKGKTIVIVSHCVAISAFLCRIMNIPFEETKLKIGIIENTGIQKLNMT